jgi:hypothetical protein
LSNSTKNLDFLQENKLIYAFQQNIVKNKKLTKYLRWFEFAEKTSDKRNEKSWFEEYMKDEVFVEIASRINTDSFITPDWQYIEDYNRYEEQLERYKSTVIKDAKVEMAFNIAIKMKNLGVAYDIIAQATGLTIKQIENLA